ncbi:hypothetical protein [Methyloraptor flagellatus]|jgi:hypothetical protein|uniref:Uncharacterized protein n=1 Tax=Methyloraptor flagellatus TaxID=3162530 RepID=A0AAU7XCF0_9HYPH
MYRTIAALFGIGISVAASALVLTVSAFDAKASADAYQRATTIILASE